MIKLSSGRPLDLVLQREHNNLDLFRLLAAVLVVFGHCYVFFPGGESAVRWDVFTLPGYPGINCGSVAVKIFFFISGLLVTNSLLQKGRAPGFLLARFFRIWPALAAVLVLTAFVIGPLFTDWGAGSYLVNPAPRAYVFDNLLLASNNDLPGVFTSPAYNFHEVSITLWTLRYEVAAYAWLLVFFSLGALRRPWACALLLVFAYADPLLPHPLLPTSQTGNPQIAYLPCCFVLGACLACWKERIVLRWEYSAAAALAWLLFRHSLLGPHLFLLAILLTVLHVSTLPAVLRLRPRADLSYGIYLWGFPVQQMIFPWSASLGFGASFCATVVATALLASLSWYGVEKPLIAFGRRLAARCEPRGE